MRKSERDRRNHIIIGLCAVVAIMAVGFAAFNQQLKINSTSEVTSTWCVGFDTTKTSDYVATAGLNGGTVPTASMSYNGNTCGSDNLQTGANLSASFAQPGDQVVYTFTIKNDSTLNAKLDSIDESITTSNSAIEYELSGAASGDVLGPNDTTTLVVTVRYKSSITSQPDTTSWGLSIKLNFSQTSEEASQGGGASTGLLATTFLSDQMSTDSTLINDGNGNIRYSGADENVHNYICLSEDDVAVDHTACQDKHLYRIIGSFSDIKKTSSDSAGETRVKVIKATQYSEDYWDTSNSNNWDRPATLNTTLNEAYYNTLDTKAKDVIETSLWYLGGNSTSEVTAAQAYAFERGSTGGGASPTTLNSSGIFALMYLSDYGYASSGCRNGEQTLYDYDNNTCKSTDWLYLNNGKYEWMLSPNSSISTGAFYVNSAGYVFSDNYGRVGSVSLVVRPTVHLKSDVTIDTEGRDGTASNPYVVKYSG